MHLLKCLLLFLFSILFSETYAQTVCFENPSTEDLYVRRIDPFIKGGFPYGVAKNGNLRSIPIYQKKPLFVSVRFLKSKSRLYLLYPNDTCVVKIDSSGAPALVRKNHQKQQELDFMSKLGSSANLFLIEEPKALPKTISIERRDDYMNEKHQRVIKFFNDNKETYGLSKEFQDLFVCMARSIDIRNKAEGEIYRYQYASKIKAFYKEKFQKTLSEIESPEASNIYELLYAADIMVEFQKLESESKYNKIDQLVRTPPIAERLKAKYLKERMDKDDKASYTLVPFFLQEVGDSLIKSILSDLYQIKTDKSLLSKSKDVLIGIDGTRITISDLLKLRKDSVILFDLWASWCKPCIQQFPYSKKLQKELAGKPVAFIYLSFDEQEDSWRKAAEDHHVTANSYLFELNFKSQFSKIFRLQSIPRYILIGKDGKLLMEDAPRPEKAELKRVIEKALLNK